MSKELKGKTVLKRCPYCNCLYKGKLPCNEVSNCLTVSLEAEQKLKSILPEPPQS